MGFLSDCVMASCHLLYIVTAEMFYVRCAKRESLENLVAASPFPIRDLFPLQTTNIHTNAEDECEKGKHPEMEK